MPFITQIRRKIIDTEGLNALHKSSYVMPGDLCYVEYKKMMEKWKENSRWTTAHNIYREVMTTSYGIDVHSLDGVVAKHLAWQVFFYKHILPYENEKEKENGDI